jgi:hypothetical protein
MLVYCIINALKRTYINRIKDIGISKWVYFVKFEVFLIYFMATIRRSIINENNKIICIVLKEVRIQIKLNLRIFVTIPPGRYNTYWKLFIILIDFISYSFSLIRSLVKLSFLIIRSKIDFYGVCSWLYIGQWISVSHD